jgi:hypothetical protein
MGLIEGLIIKKNSAGCRVPGAQQALQLLGKK